MVLEINKTMLNDFPCVEVGKWTCAEPRMAMVGAEDDFQWKRKVLKANNIYVPGDPWDTHADDQFQPEGWETMENKAIITHRMIAINKYYAQKLGGKFNRRLGKVAQAAFLSPFHRRVSRHITGHSGLVHRSALLRKDDYVALYSIRTHLNALGSGNDPWLPWCVCLGVSMSALKMSFGPEISLVISSSTPRRMEKAARAFFQSRKRPGGKLDQALIFSILALPNVALDAASMGLIMPEAYHLLKAKALSPGGGWDDPIEFENALLKSIKDGMADGAKEYRDRIRCQEYSRGLLVGSHADRTVWPDTQPTLPLADHSGSATISSSPLVAAPSTHR